MRRAAIIPVKRLSDVKSRLGTRLEKSERVGLSVSMLSHVVQACMEAGFHPVCVSPDPEVEKIARTQRWGYIKDRGKSLNTAVEKALKSLSAQGYKELVVVHPDLPLLTQKDLKQISTLARFSDAVICPNLDASGTNIVYLRRPRAFHPRYGRNSYVRHLKGFTSRGFAVKTYISLGTALDLDTPRDLRLLSLLRTSPQG
ncbi:2-phospho-L-lactate guanylyltransferase [archaeon HR01]|nr:2-phospho-L-lactate guanylyltransferase [archaeon HR01]